jgi:hypothetical protein
MSISLNGTTGIQFPDSSLQSAAASPYVLKNRIINGAMGIWQRGTSFTSSNTFVYTADRWYGFCAATATISRSSSVPTGQQFQYSLQLQRPNAGTNTSLIFAGQVIESVNMYDLAGQTVTLSFWAKSGANFSGTTANAIINTGTVADQGSALSLGSWTGAAQPGNYSFTPTTTWTKFTTTVTISSSALEMASIFYFTPSGTAGADDSLYITGVQLEQNTSATPFERRLYGQELANCQRYYYNHVTGSGLSICSGFYYTATAIMGTINFPTTMRASPTVSATSGTDYYRILRNGATDTFNTIDLQVTNTNCYTMYQGSNLSGTVGQGGSIETNNASSFVSFTAEL